MIWIAYIGWCGFILSLLFALLFRANWRRASKINNGMRESLRELLSIDDATDPYLARIIRTTAERRLIGVKR